MYILECADGSYYTGSTTYLERRLAQHQAGEGANHTKKRLPVKLVYYEEFQRIDEAFYREKQVQGWSRKKKEALINNMPEELHELAKCMNKSSHLNYTGGFDSAQPPEGRNSVQAPAERNAAQPTQEKTSAQQPEEKNTAQPREERNSTQPPKTSRRRCLSVAEDSDNKKSNFKKLGV